MLINTQNMPQEADARFTELKEEHGLSTEEEVGLLYLMLTSRNPLRVLSGKFLIWERNGTLIKILQVIAVIALIIVFIVVRR